MDAAIGNWGLRRAAHVVLQTNHQARMLQETYGRVAALVVHNCQPLPDQLPRRDGQPLRVVWIGNLRPIKRPELFVELARRLTHVSNAEFLLVGRVYDGRYSDIAQARERRRTSGTSGRCRTPMCSICCPGAMSW